MEIRKTHDLRNRVLYMIFVLVVYVLGRSILLFGVSDAGIGTSEAGAQTLMNQMLSGDRYKVTVMALGIMPYINASLTVQIISALRGANARAKVSKQKSDRWMLIATLLFAVLAAVVESGELTYKSMSMPHYALRAIVTVEMIAGAMLAYALCMSNEKRGIGASMPVILVNLLTSNIGQLRANHFAEHKSLVLICLLVIAVTVLMENKLIRIPLQRVSIHNIHADQNYIAYKLNPVGIMPVMFSASVVLILRYLFLGLTYAFPNCTVFETMFHNVVLDRPVGIVIYLVIIVVLSVVFSVLMLNPWETARQFRKNGDSIIGIYAGKATSKYLVTLVLKWSIISGAVQASFLAVSLILSYWGNIPAALAMTPTAVMVLVSITCSLVHEIANYWRYDRYSFFI